MNSLMGWSLVVGAVLVLGFGSWWFYRWRQNRREMAVPEYPRDPFFIYVKEGKRGMLETAVSDELPALSNPYKEQIAAFLRGVLDRLEVKPGGKK